MSQIAIFPGSFDPLTLGHENIVERALKLFNEIIIAVASQPDNRSFLLDHSTRIKLCTQTFSHNPAVKVVSLAGLLVQCAQKHQAQVIIRGLRNTEDSLHEFSMADANRHLGKGMETIFLNAEAPHSRTNASLVRQIAQYPEVDLSPWVNNTVARTLHEHCPKP